MKAIQKFLNHKTKVKKGYVALVTIVLVAAVGIKLITTSHAASIGVVPPAVPGASLAPNPVFNSTDYCYIPGTQYVDTSACNSGVQQATTSARSQLEGLGPLMTPQQLSVFQSMPIPEQEFALVNLERASRNLKPVTGMTTQLDQDAQAGANAQGDPSAYVGSISATPSPDAQVWGGGNFCETDNPYECNYGYMYDDGYGGWNGACTAGNTSACWEHRNSILSPGTGSNWNNEYGYCGNSASSSQLYMGAAYSTATGNGSVSFAEVIVGACGTGTPTGVIYNWNSVLAALNSGSGTPVPTSSNKIPASDGYWEVAGDGGVFSYGNAQYAGSTPSGYTGSFTSMAHYGKNDAYWLLDSTGQIYAYKAPYYGGSPTGYNGSFVGIEYNGSSGYWLLDSTGQIYSYGNAAYYGGSPTGYNGSFVGIAATPDHRGYWLVDSTGQVYAYGDAAYYGAPVGQNSIVGITASPNGGYWEVSSSGGVFSYNAPFYGSAPGLGYTENNIVGISQLADGGYVVEGSNATSFWFSASGSSGTIAALTLNQPAVGGAGTGIPTVPKSPVISPATVGLLPPTKFQSVYAVGSDGQVWQSEWLDSGGWSRWQTMGHGSATLTSGVTYGINQLGNANIFAVGSDGNVYQNFWTGADWSGWTSMGHGSVKFTEGITVGRNQDNQNDLFAVGSDGNVYQNSWTSKGWSGWSSMGSPTGIELSSGISATHNQSGTENLFATGSNGNVYQKYWTGLGWSGWNTLGHGSARITSGLASPPNPLP
jgi:hypothetical protein